MEGGSIEVVPVSGEDIVQFLQPGVDLLASFIFFGYNCYVSIGFVWSWAFVTFWCFLLDETMDETNFDFWVGKSGN